MLIYALVFCAVPLARAAWLAARNVRVDDRNARRENLRAALDLELSKPKSLLAAKVRFARTCKEADEHVLGRTTTPTTHARI